MEGKFFFPWIHHDHKIQLKKHEVIGKPMCVYVCGGGGGEVVRLMLGGYQTPV